MIDIATVRDWVGGTTADDARLAIILAGVQSFLATETRRLWVSPPQAYEEILDVPTMQDGGLSRLDADSTQRLGLRYEPQGLLSGTATIVAGSTIVTGTSTKFLTQLEPGSPIRISGVDAKVATIASDTSLTLEEAHPGATAAKIFGGILSVASRLSTASSWEVVDAATFELDAKSLYSTTEPLSPGNRAARVRYLVGYHSGEAPSDVILLLLDLAKAVHSKIDRELSSISIGGKIAVSWESFGEESARLKMRADILREPMGFSASSGHLLVGNYNEWTS